jgi:RHS repeat-associated protein
MKTHLPILIVALLLSLRFDASAQDAGQTPINVDVSATGAGTFTMPIALPSGIGGATPQLALSYNSQSGNGLAGYGANIAGLSSITRLPKTKFHDGVVGTINNDTEDRFALDGQRLILKSGSYGDANSEYTTENYSNIRIFCRYREPVVPDYGLQTFEVWYPDGSKAFYGIADDKTYSEWAISYRINALGARINYTYTRSNNVLYISDINYGNLGESQTLNNVHFSYQTASRPEQSYVAGRSYYRDQLLNKISVKSNETWLKHYKLEYEKDAWLNYEMLEFITEFDGTETHSKPKIYLSFNSTGSLSGANEAVNIENPQGIASNTSEASFFDFNGNGIMDYFIYPKDKSQIYAFFDKGNSNPMPNLGHPINPGIFKETFPVTFLTHDNKIASNQGLLVIKEDGANYKFTMYGTASTSSVLNMYEKTWVTSLPEYTFQDCNFIDNKTTRFKMNFLPGDFNGDGLTDIIAINDTRVQTGIIPGTWPSPDDPRSGSSPCEPIYEDKDSRAYIINLNRNVPDNFTIDLGPFIQSYSEGDKLYPIDANGDGRTDILHVKDGKMFVYTVRDNTLELLSQTYDAKIKPNYQQLIGDYNGDGKMDIIFATADGNTESSLFAIFISTGSSFNKAEQNLPFNSSAGKNGSYPISHVFSSDEVVTYERNYLTTNDVNADGKTDIVLLNSYTEGTSTDGRIKCKIYSPVANSIDGVPTFDMVSDQISYGNVRPDAIPIVLAHNAINSFQEAGFISDHTITTFRFDGTDGYRTLKTVMHNGVYHHFSYQKAMSGGVYNGELKYDYPFMNLMNVPSLLVVDKMTREFGTNNILQQTFSYANAVSNVEGLGFLGFGQTTRSNWHVDENDVNRMYTITLTDPNLRGAVSKSFVAKSPSISTNIADMATTDDNGTLSDYISRTDYIYKTETLPNKVFVNLPISVTAKDLLNGTNTVQASEYDEYYNVTKSTTNMSGAGTKTEVVTYENNLDGYYMGRPLTKTTTMDAGGSYSTQEEYTYTGFLPTMVKKKGEGTDWITETMVYDAFGNVTQKTVSTPNSGSRSNSMAYDATGRFMTSATDADGMTSTSTYDPAMGTILSKTNPYSQTESFEYDTWGRPTQTTDYLGKKAYKKYDSDGNGGIILTASDDEGAETKTYVNALGQTTEAITKTVLGGYVGKKTEYDIYGRTIKESQPDAQGSYSQWNETLYDDYGRPTQSTSYTGKTTSISYSGLSTTVNDGTKSITTTKNALGQTLGVQDPGGTINYSYHANGQLKTADYGGSVQALEYDGWGRKTKLTDPSAGVYTYAYNDFGEITEETTPKGTTKYTYDATGTLTAKTLTGDAANLGYNYTYNGTTKLLESMALTNADGNNTNYSYTYDAQFRPVTTVEDNLHAQFTKTYTYDDFGRPATEGSEAKNKRTGHSASRTIAFTYQNGELLQSTDVASGQILSKVNTLNSKGLLTSEQMGGSLTKSYSYDSYNLPSSTVLERTGFPSPLLSLGYSFDALRGNLNSRSNSFNGVTESFTYDTQDRLTGIGGNGVNSSQTYDERGRITSNSQLGNYGYNGVGYQQTELTGATTEATAWYADHSLQQINYNAFKQPVSINEEGKAKIDFQYNGALQRSHMYYGSNDADKDTRPMRRHYSEDGSMEITEDVPNGKVDFVFYLNGDAYDAPAIYKNTQTTNNENTDQLYYLHRDHLGSIVMITNQTGDIAEQRAFDAWGNVVAISDGAGNPLNAFVVLDRGYTGHEHLFSVGLIHMNGRLYDPKLHRFLSPDNFVQDPTNTQNFNRYGYVMNNPLVRTDPNGEFIFSLLLPGIGTFIDAALWGAVIGGAGYTASVAFSPGGFNNWNGGQFWKSVGFGAISGVATAGIGSAFGEVGKFGHELTRGMAHGLSNGIISDLSGGSFLQGFASGGLGSLAGSGFQAWGGNFAQSGLGQIGFSAASGGVGAELTGGNFWEGAAVGATVGLLNHMQNTIQQRIARTAEKYEGSEAWAYDASIDNFPDGVNKCNKFVYDVAAESGASPGLTNSKRWPPTAGQWADSDYKIKGWKVVANPRRGDVVAIKGNFSDASGHTGIMISNKLSIGASHSVVRRTDFGSNTTRYSDYPGNKGYIYRRYIGR